MTITVKAHQSRRVVLKQSGDYTIKLAGEGAEAKIIGAFWLKNGEQLELNVTTIHQVPHTSADTFIRVVVDGGAQATVNGTILVKPGAQQTNSFLTENILLLSPQARAQAIPNLEIEANDVKCSHAATVGKIDPQQLFYLESRGIDAPAAKSLIAQGFLDAVKQKSA